MHNIKSNYDRLVLQKNFCKICRTVCMMKNSDDWKPAKILWKLLIMSVFFQVETDLKGC